MVLDASLFNTQNYKRQIKGKRTNPRERSSTLPDTSVVAIEKGSYQVALSYN